MTAHVALEQGTRRDEVKVLGNGVCAPVMRAVVGSLLGAGSREILYEELAPMRLRSPSGRRAGGTDQRRTYAVLLKLPGRRAGAPCLGKRFPDIRIEAVSPPRGRYFPVSGRNPCRPARSFLSTSFQARIGCWTPSIRVAARAIIVMIRYPTSSRCPIKVVSDTGAASTRLTSLHSFLPE